MRSPRATRRARLNLERLEARETPAGAVTLNLINNTFSFTGDGDAAGNEVRVTATSSNNFLIEGLSGTKFVVDGANIGGTIDTSLIPDFAFPNNGTTKINVKFLGGPDRFEYDGFINGQEARAFADITLDMGAGNDTVFSSQFIAKNLTIKSTAPTGAATDNDTVTIAAGGLFELDPLQLGPESVGGGIRKNLTITGMTGSDLITLAATVGGNVTVALKDAADTFSLQGASRVGGNVVVTETPTTVLGANNFNIMENVQIGKNVTFTNTKNAANATLFSATIGGNLMLNATGSTAASTFTFDNTTVGGNADIKSGTGADTANVTQAAVGKNFSLAMGDGGNGAGDLLYGVNVSGNLKITYGKGADILNLANSNILASTTITGSDGQDRLTVQNNIFGKNFAYTGGAGGNFGAGTPDVIDGVRVGGTFTVTYGAGNEGLELNNSSITGAAKVTGGNGNDTINIENMVFLGHFSVIGGTGQDAITLSRVFVYGNTTVTTSGGNDTVNISVFGRYKGKVTINTGGAGADDDTININADLGNEVAFLGGVNIVTGGGADSADIGDGDGLVVVLNNLTYPDAANLSDTVNTGNNLLII